MLTKRLAKKAKADPDPGGVRPPPFSFLRELMSAIELLVGLGNPGRDYADTRHNAGAWLVETIARDFQTSLQNDSKFHGLNGRVRIDGHEVRLLIPTTFMNLSGKAIAALANFYKISPEQILVAHDELDFDPGIARFKQGGGAGGHNGLRSTIESLGNNRNFHRLRIGIGHPGSAAQVHNYVLGRPSTEDRHKIDDAIDEAIRCLPMALTGNWPQAMNRLHAFRAA